MARTTRLFTDCAASHTFKKRAEKRYVVLSLKKNGWPYNVTNQDLDGMNSTRTFARAVERKDIMQRLNPNSRFVILAI